MLYTYIRIYKLGLEFECELYFKLKFKKDKMDLANLIPFTTIILDSFIFF